MTLQIPTEVSHALSVAEAACRVTPSRGYLAYALAYLQHIPNIQNEPDLRTQILYVLNNLAAWTGPAAREAKRVLSAYAEEGANA